MKKYLIGFILGFIIGPIAVVEGFGHYTQWKIDHMDRQNVLEAAMHENGFGVIENQKRAVDEKRKFMKDLKEGKNSSN